MSRHTDKGLATTENAAQPNGPSYWLVVESPSNWAADRKRGFVSLGVSDRFRSTAALMRKGDVLVAYVSKVGAFADARTVESETLGNADEEEAYDRPFPWEVKTSSLVALERDQWVRVKELLEELELTRGKSNWCWVFRTSIKRIDDSDGRRIVAEIRRAAAKAIDRTDEAR